MSHHVTLIHIVLHHVTLFHIFSHVENKIAMFVRCAAMLVHASTVEHARLVTFEQRARSKNLCEEPFCANPTVRS